MRKLILYLLALTNVSNMNAMELPYFVQDWQGVYTKTTRDGVGDKQSFEIRNHCFIDNKEAMGEFVCEIGYSKNGSEFDNWEINFYTEKLNDMNYGIVRIVEIKSAKEATIKVFSMEYSNDFCNIDVKKQDNVITLTSGGCKISDFVLHNNIFGRYSKEKERNE